MRDAGCATCGGNLPRRASRPRAATRGDRRRERVDLAERVADPASGGGVLVMARVANEHPPRAGRVAEEPRPAHGADYLAYPPSALQRGRHGLALGDVSHQTALDVAAE